MIQRDAYFEKFSEVFSAELLDLHQRSTSTEATQVMSLCIDAERVVTMQAVGQLIKTE